MDKETIKKLIQLTPEQKTLLLAAREALVALCNSGVGLFYDFENYETRAVNLNGFKYTEIEDGRYQDNYEDSGMVTIPYWDGEPIGDFACYMATDDYLYGEVNPALVDRDKNLFNLNPTAV